MRVHTKFMLVGPLSDDPVGITGSANFSDPSTDTSHEPREPARHPTPFAQWNDPARPGSAPFSACEGNIAIVPGREPMAFALLTFAAAATLIAFFGAGFVRTSHGEGRS